MIKEPHEGLPLKSLLLKLRLWKEDVVWHYGGGRTIIDSYDGFTFKTDMDDQRLAQEMVFADYDYYIYRLEYEQKLLKAQEK